MTKHSVRKCNVFVSVPPLQLSEETQSVEKNKALLIKVKKENTLYRIKSTLAEREGCITRSLHSLDRMNDDEFMLSLRFLTLFPAEVLRVKR